MLYFVGLGLGDAKDITVKGLEEEFYGRDLILADREMVEQQSDELFRDAETDDVAFLVVGDPFGATTHTDLALRAKREGIEYKVIHNASIMNAIGCCGLQLYNFGETISIVFWTDTWTPDSYYDKIASNRERGLHTLCLLDIKVKEQSIENMMRGRKIYEAPRYMTVSQACSQLIQILERKRKLGIPEILAYSEETPCVGVARVGSDTQQMVAGTLQQLVLADLGGPLHSLVIAGHMHPLELEMLKSVAMETSLFDRLLTEAESR